MKPQKKKLQIALTAIVGAFVPFLATWSGKVSDGMTPKQALWSALGAIVAGLASNSQPNKEA